MGAVVACVTSFAHAQSMNAVSILRTIAWASNLRAIRASEKRVANAFVRDAVASAGAEIHAANTPCTIFTRILRVTFADAAPFAFAMTCAIIGAHLAGATSVICPPGVANTLALDTRAVARAIRRWDAHDLGAIHAGEALLANAVAFVAKAVPGAVLRAAHTLAVWWSIGLLADASAPLDLAARKHLRELFAQDAR